MTTVFIAGSISIKRLHEKVQERIGNVVSSNFDVVVGDADGADAGIQECLKKHRATKVTVYCTGEVPRNNVASWPVCRVSSKAKVGSRAFFTAKDLAMARRGDYGLMIWDCKSTGTLSNVIELLRENKKSVVFASKTGEFITISDKNGLNCLLGLMSTDAKDKAETKIGLSSKIASITQADLTFEASGKESSPEAQCSLSDPAGPAENRASFTENMRLRSVLVAALKDHICGANLSQSQAAKIFGVTQPRISDLTRGKIDLFGLEALVSMAEAAGLRVEMQVLREPGKSESIQPLHQQEH